MTVLIVDDTEAIRARLATMLNEVSGVEMVGQAGTVAQAVTALRQMKPDAMTLDLRLPDGNGLDVLQLISREHLPTVVIVLTNYPYAQYEKRARAEGAYAFLNKAKDFIKIPGLLELLVLDGFGPAARVRPVRNGALQAGDGSPSQASPDATTNQVPLSRDQ